VSADYDDQPGRSCFAARTAAIDELMAKHSPAVDALIRERDAAVKEARDLHQQLAVLRLPAIPAFALQNARAEEAEACARAIRPEPGALNWNLDADHANELADVCDARAKAHREGREP
jgi:hypothetical protein